MSLQLHLSCSRAAASTTPNANSPFPYSSSSSYSYKVAHLPFSSSFHGRDLCLGSNAKVQEKQQQQQQLCFSRKFTTRVFAMSSSSDTRFKMNLNEYMVTLQKPLGIRFALSADGKIFVHALRKGGNAEKARIIMVGDALKKASTGPDGVFIEIKDFEHTQKLLKEDKGSFSLVLERPSSPFPIQQYSSISQLVCVSSEEEPGEAEWGHGSFPLEEYIKALDRAKGELCYDHSLGMRYSKITEQLYVGSCIQTEADVQALAKDVGVTAVLNFQTVNECANWGIDSQSINNACRNSNILMVNYPIREVDSFDLRKKLPLCTGLLLRLLKKNLRVYVTCTTGFDRAPASIIAYLHWMQDTSLHDAYNFVTGLHPCMPNRAAIVWATWDLIAMARDNRNDRPPTHAVTFVWNGREGEDVSVVGDFTENWKEPIKLVHKGGPKYEAEVKLKQGKYYYKFIANGNWRHSTSSPTVTDGHGNMNNVITVGDTASIRPSSIQQQTKDTTVVKVIERSLTEYERVILARAARCVTFSICPIRLAPKK